jgi:hypothetical protein
LAGPTATVQNSPPLVTSNKARQKYGLPVRKNPDGSDARFDALRAQRLAAPAKVYVECFSAHPLEADAAELYGPPDGYLDAKGVFHREPTSPRDKAVFEIDILPDDGLYPLPYMARKSDGGAWEGECTEPGAPASQARQSFYPDGSRSFEEIDRLGIGAAGIGNLISSFADVDFYRVRHPVAPTSARVTSRRKHAARISSRTGLIISARLRHDRRWRGSPMPRGGYSTATNMTEPSIPRAVRRSRRSLTGSIF